jgi:hypothetical protein
MDTAAPRDPAPDDGARLRSLTVLANALAAATRVEALVEVVAEEALRAMGAASLSVSRWDRERGVLRTLINVGELGPGEDRNPEDEVYRLEEFPVANDLLLRGQPYVLREDRPGDPAGKAIAERLEKGSQVGVPIMASERMGASSGPRPAAASRPSPGPTWTSSRPSPARSAWPSSAASCSRA